MEEPKSLDSLFKEKLFRIPDYQRGYAWQREQLKDFWEDLLNLSDNRSHYTGVLTLKEISSETVDESDKEYGWSKIIHTGCTISLTDSKD